MDILDINECGIECIEWIGTNDMGEPRHGKWRKINVSWCIKGLVQGYEWPNDIVLENVEPRTMF